SSKNIIPHQSYMPGMAHSPQVSLYDWIRLHDKERRSTRHKGPAVEEPVQLEADSEFEDNYDEEESEDELLLTTESNNKLKDETQLLTATEPSSGKKKKIHLRFHPNHPQYQSRHVKLVDESEAYVPNFIGGSMPSRDTGNREQYCLTMLTLFKPWRSGKDLRPNADMLWDDVFREYQFTPRQQDIMKYFHIRYECNDARDDFAAARKRGLKAGSAPFNMDDRTLDHMDTQFYTNDGEVSIDELEDMILQANDWTKLSNAEVNRRTQMLQAEQIIRASGWMDPMENKTKADIPPQFWSKEDMSAADWKNVLASKKQEILDARDAQADLKKPVDPKTGLPKNTEVNEVKVIDK
ncbi:hypothetical protein OH77DRAFT_1372129, partial [Trametes cingulata]